LDQGLHDGDDIPAQLRSWKQSGCRGIILLGTEMQSQDLSHFMNIDIPLVLLDNYFEEVGIKIEISTTLQKRKSC